LFSEKNQVNIRQSKLSWDNFNDKIQYSNPGETRMPTYILPIDNETAQLEQVGGKGLNLSRLYCEGFPIPQGFVLTTEAYRFFVTENQLEQQISAILESRVEETPEAFQILSEQIRGLFQTAVIPGTLREQALKEFKALKAKAVAVRSSATAEDLPDQSFAGQQDTFLNVHGEEDFLHAVVNCWSSLWTARAISYRQRNQISPEGIALAVVVQEMLESETSGVMFTANPLTGSRHETVIDATFGLGEALVSGQVEPDHYVVDWYRGRLVEKRLGKKALILRAAQGGGIIHQENSNGNNQSRQVISDRGIAELTRMGQQIEAFFGSPQDIEWAWAGGILYLLQSRPVTSLYPLPVDDGSLPLRTYFSFASVQGLMDPITPMGQDVIRVLFAGLAGFFGYPGNHLEQVVIRIAGERLWIDFTPLARTQLGRKIVSFAMGNIEPGIVGPLQKIYGDPRLNDGSGFPKLTTIRRFAGTTRTMRRGMLEVFRHPEGKARQVRAESDALIADLEQKYPLGDGKALSIAKCADLVGELEKAFPRAAEHITASAFSGLLSMFFLMRIGKKLPGAETLTLEITRGLPNNITTEMDLKLWKITQLIRQNEEAITVFKGQGADLLSQLYLSGQLPDKIQRALDGFMGAFGMRGLAEIDFGRPRWRENPQPVMQIIRNYLEIDDASQAPDAVFAKGEQTAKAAIEQFARLARRGVFGKLRSRWVRRLANQMREFAGLREFPKYFIIRMMGVARSRLLALGQQLCQGGFLRSADDLCYLQLEELRALGFYQQEHLDVLASDPEWVRIRELIKTRRNRYAVESRRKQIPRLLISDGRAYYDGLSNHLDDETHLSGSPVSPGVVEGIVRVVLDPHKAELKPGEILVCPATDPAWTPLFLSAGGLVMEVGGMMTHGSVVAREYGIPAVVGVHEVTMRLNSGDRIRIDGTSGIIEIIEKNQTN
jgi:pyruvate,water dikinase